MIKIKCIFCNEEYDNNKIGAYYEVCNKCGNIAIPYSLQSEEDFYKIIENKDKIIKYFKDNPEIPKILNSFNYRSICMSNIN